MQRNTCDCVVKVIYGNKAVFVNSLWFGCQRQNDNIFPPWSAFLRFEKKVKKIIVDDASLRNVETTLLPDDELNN